MFVDYTVVIVIVAWCSKVPASVKCSENDQQASDFKSINKVSMFFLDDEYLQYFVMIVFE